MFVVDTNIIAPLYIRGARTVVVQALRRRDHVWRTDPFALIELSNLLASYQRAGYLTRASAQQCLREARNLLDPHYFVAQHEEALAVAMDYRITAYDARFLVVAQQLGSRLVTEDVKLRRAAPALTQSLDEALAST